MNIYDVQRDLNGQFEPLQVDVLWGLLTLSESALADRLGITGGRLRHLLFKSVARLEEMAKVDAKFTPYYERFKQIAADLPSTETPWKTRAPGRPPKS